MLKLNLSQRIIALVSGVLLLLFAIDAADSWANPNPWLATAQFVLAVIFFIVAASPGRARQN